MQEATGQIPQSRRSPGRANGYPLQYSCLRNPMDIGAWWATVHGVAKKTEITQQLNKNKYPSSAFYFIYNSLQQKCTRKSSYRQMDRQIDDVCMLSHFSHVGLFATLWTQASHAPLSVEFSRQEYWSGLSCPSPRQVIDKQRNRQMIDGWMDRQVSKQMIDR